ncbi:aminotransferase-like domain-containing protein [Streptomyces sp. NPDC001975]
MLGSIGFLNEVMARYPDAISFAPGAPYPGFLDGIDTERYTRRFLEHLADEQRLGPVKARRLLFEYGPSRGLINGVVAGALRRDHGIDAAPETLVITVGAQEALFLVLRALFPTSAEQLAVAVPCFPGVVGAARLLGIGLVGVRETADGIDLDALEAACRAARHAGRPIRACYVAPDFANPGGSRMSPESRHQLLRLATREDFLLLEDNVYGFTAASGAGLPPLKALDSEQRVIHIGTFAKVCFPGARVGYVVADQPVGARRTLADELAALKSMVTVNTSPLAQAVIGGMLLEHGGSLARLGRAKSALYQRNLTLLCAALERHLGAGEATGVTWNRPEGGFFVRVNLPVPANEALLEISAARHGVLWTPMSHFHLDDTGDTQLRLSCSYLDTEEIETGVSRFAAFLTQEIGS